MQFIDRTKIIVKAGDGGHGKSAFRREKFIPKGGPSGGDGGRGADVILKVDRNMNTLLDFRYHRKFVGKNGGNGDIKNQYGKNAPQCIIKVPAGTLVKDAETGEVLADLVNEGDEAIVAKGGRGGRGNAKFATSANRAPTFAELGEPGEGRTLLLELKLLADVGLVGYPSVGKSSIIASVSAARPEIADYHFTTITPVLGVVSLGDAQNFVMADIPGLIEGASGGVGLGQVANDAGGGEPPADLRVGKALRHLGVFEDGGQYAAGAAGGSGDDGAVVGILLCHGIGKGGNLLKFVQRRNVGIRCLLIQKFSLPLHVQPTGQYPRGRQSLVNGALHHLPHFH